jgi:hypothetical protein
MPVSTRSASGRSSSPSALDQPAPELALQLGQAAVHGRLVHAERFRGRDRAAVAGDRQQVAQVAPLDHAGVYAILSDGLAILQLPAHGCLTIASDSLN